MTREPIYAALFSLLNTSLANAGFVTTSRKLQHWADVDASEQPCLFMKQKSEVAKTTRGQPTLWTLAVELYIYVNTQQQNNPSIVPTQLLNPLLDAVVAALPPDNLSDYALTLGGLVSHCRIDGVIETSEGNLGDQEVAIIPISILVAS